MYSSQQYPPSGMHRNMYQNPPQSKYHKPPQSEYRNPPQSEYHNPPQGEYHNPPESVYDSLSQGGYQDPPLREYQPSSQRGYQQSDMSYQQHVQTMPTSEGSLRQLSFGNARMPTGAREYSEDGKYTGMCIEVVSDAHLHSFPSMASFSASTVSGGGLPRTHSSSGYGTTHSSNGSGGAAFSDVLSQDSLIEDDRDDIERRRVLLAEAKARADAVFEQQQANDQYVRQHAAQANNHTDLMQLQDMVRQLTAQQHKHQQQMSAQQHQHQQQQQQ